MSITSINNRMGRSDKLLLAGLIVAGIIVGISYSLLAKTVDLRLFMPEMIGLSGVILATVCVLLCFPCPVQKRKITFVLMTLAIFFRLLFILSPPQLSDDVYRYLWDGAQLFHGHNPYAQAPQQVVAPSAELTKLQGQINHAHLVTIYPPAAQLFFALSGGSLLVYKLVCSLVDLGSCLLLLHLLQRMNRSPLWLAVYAWHPLVILEGTGSGHIDILAVFFLLGALTLAISPKVQTGAGCGLLWMLAVMTKVFPLIFGPFLWLALPVSQRRAFFVSATATALVLVLPFSPEILNALDTLGTYSRHWEFSGFTFQQLRRWLGSGDLTRLLLAAVFILILCGSWLHLRSHCGERTFPERLLRVLLFILLAFLLLTPTLHPWYALYLVAFVALTPHVAGLVLSWSVLLSYQVVTVYHLSGVWQEQGALAFYIWSAPLLALALSALLGRFKARRRS
nr:glycosyltransferase 87 family protein [uncultured Desulfuromonas sp.]